MKISVVVATHKKYKMPKYKSYLPLHVGCEGKESLEFKGDNTGDNISKKNSNFCELTGLYWAWKNLKDDYIGLVHYRRYFKGNSKSKDIFERILSDKEIGDLIKSNDIILPKKRNYYIETLYSHYEHTMYVEPLDITGKIIQEKYPDYYKEFELLKKRTSAHMFNMFIMKRDILNEYCTWLFDILFELEKKVDNSQYDSFHGRFYGRVSELLLDVWLNTKGYTYKEVPLLNIEKVNWIKKGSSFLKAKFFGKKYDKSF